MVFATNMTIRTTMAFVLRTPTSRPPTCSPTSTSPPITASPIIFFQTNEGPSYPAHQFLFTGTSAPVAPKDSNNYYLDFIGENANGFLDTGCPEGQQNNGKPQWVDPTGTEFKMNYYECYTHDSLVTNSNGDKGVTWFYYAPTPEIIWDAPAAIPEVCYGENDLNKVGQPCTASEFTNHVMLPLTQSYDSAPILDDIANCNLQKISWVIPDQMWSDHPGGGQFGYTPYGPSWVGDIIDAVGTSWTNSNHKCDYWGNNSSTPEPTAVFVVWDDWGGWFDHVTPPNVYRAGQKNCPDDTKQWGCGYTYGFRVPFLAVSEYTGTLSNGNYSGYVSGACNGNCPQKVFPYVHD